MSGTQFLYRRASIDDLPGMCDLFRRSYGERSPFSSVGFARAYFECRREEGTKEQLNSFIGLRIRDGEVVAHYGVRPQWFRWGGQRFLLGWGVNAITSADHIPRTGA